MKHVLFSIKPEHVVNIINGDKNKELRKTIPHDSLPFCGYIYCTKGKGYACVDKNGVASFIKEARYDVISRLGLTVLNGTVCASFTCDGFDVLHGGKVVSDRDEMIAIDACVSSERIEKYGDGRDIYALNLADVNIFKKPYPLSAMHTYMVCDTQIKYCALTRPPQSWQYVNKLKEEME